MRQSPFWSSRLSSWRPLFISLRPLFCSSYLQCSRAFSLFSLPVPSKMDGITIFVAAIIVIVCALPFGLLAALFQHPWLIWVLFAIVGIYLALQKEKKNLH
ncbi:MAG: hypothetical protein P4L53_04945 [Candidatus Obscuribacterales bacterium]|nr:hypothetical protein [Candidatus Obscuribacterales bacterium]